MSETLGEELERNIPLYEMIQTLRSELQAAMLQGEGQNLRFQVKEIELELLVAVARERKMGGGIKFWVLDATGEQRAAEHVTHKFKLKLEPISSDGTRESPLISDTTTRKPI